MHLLRIFFAKGARWWNKVQLHGSVYKHMFVPEFLREHYRMLGGHTLPGNWQMYAFFTFSYFFMSNRMAMIYTL